MIGRNTQPLLKSAQLIFNEYLVGLQLYDKLISTRLKRGWKPKFKEFSEATVSFAHGGFPRGGNWITLNGYAAIEDVSSLVLQQEHLSTKISANDATNDLIRALSDQIERMRITPQDFSPHKLLGALRKSLRARRYGKVIHVLPVLITLDPIPNVFWAGPVRLMSAKQFLEKHGDQLRTLEDRWSSIGSQTVVDFWKQYTTRYSHVILVELEGYQFEMGRRMSREAADWFLNLIRMTFGMSATRSITIAGGSIWDEQSVSLALNQDGSVGYHLKDGPWAGNLDDDWLAKLEDHLHDSAIMAVSALRRLVDGRYTLNPEMERLRYFNQLIAEAFCEPYDHLRLVRIISALEAIALLDRHDKAKNLAFRCALAGGRSDVARANLIEKDILRAYNLRNAIVHGDSAPAGEVRAGLYRIERHLLQVYLGFLRLYIGISNATKPNSVKQLRREVEKRLHAFFYSPDIAVSDSSGFRLSNL